MFWPVLALIAPVYVGGERHACYRQAENPYNNEQTMQLPIHENVSFPDWE
jgi:hypothetical protein